MTRFHLNLKVADLEKSREFYSHLFGAEPAVVKPDYVKWMLDDPFINFSIEPGTGDTGIAHVGLQAENPDELRAIYDRVQDAAGPRFEEGETTCCYASSEKNWTSDPDGVIWEAFHTEGQVTHYGKVPEMGKMSDPTSCCLS
ncbi:Catechol 2,3-dioxygenase [Parasphingorhabdus marina DSM 22363]|uniref:Catechol 2,3-dioxygenase n=1 Tax=Parasphingorhabdus marina DSM 22363 TaxID=1123272 RepID=A0A1N6ESP1_9SPHN|nr:VOC family protein [Parasphingorhabdus marina]SIN86036.1 Catechol 2,3-dioxygenase [Parasphingorhabdus marina DSM 22363]